MTALVRAELLKLRSTRLLLVLLLATLGMVALTIAVGLLLFIACLNVGNLLLLRASSRARELSVRRALGATYVDIAQQLLVEAGAVAVLAGAVGFVLAELLLRVLVSLAPPGIPRLDDIQFSRAPVATAIGISSPVRIAPWKPCRTIRATPAIKAARKAASQKPERVAASARRRAA